MSGVAPSTLTMGSRNGVAFPRVSFLSHPQSVQLRLERAPIDYFGRRKLIAHDVFSHQRIASAASRDVVVLRGIS